MSHHNDFFRKSAALEKTLAFAISAALLVSVVSCGKNSSKSTNQAKKGADSTQTSKTVQIIAFEDDNDEEDNKKNNSGEEENVTTTTTTMTSKKKTTTTTTTTSSTQKKTSKTASKTTSTEKTLATQAAPQRDNSYKIVDKTYTAADGKIKCTYPQITGLYDETMQSYYNKLFQSECEAAAGDSSLENFSGTYEVKLKNKDKLSIVFRHGVFYKGAAHPYSYAYAYTIDLATGNTIIPSESVNMNKAADAILNDSWTLTRSTDGVGKSDVIEYFNQYDEKTIKSNLSVENVIKVKNNNGKYTKSGSVGCRSYLDGTGEPVLILEVNHALGDYVEVQF